MNISILKLLLIILGFTAILGSTFKILKEYERAVVFRLGKLLATKGPGLVFLIPLIDRIKRIDMRLVSVDVPRQDIMTRDNVPVTLDAVVYFKIVDPAQAVITIQDIYHSTFLLAQATLRNVLGQVELDDLLSQQAKINQQLEQIISVHTKQWGIHISIVEIKEVSLPEEMKRAMAKQAETERERRARLIDAQGELQASQTLAEAGKILSGSPQGLQLRYLQTLRDISTNKGSTILFPLPIDLLGPFVDGTKRVLQEVFKTRAEEQPEEGEKGGPARTEEPRLEEEAPRPEVQPVQDARIIQDLITQYEQEMREGRLQPRYVQWVITDQCQFRCSHCETATKSGKTKELTTNQAKKAIDELAALGCQFLSITGGEPLLREDIFEIARYAKEKGLNLGLTTNGEATEENLAPLAEIKFDSVVLTLDGYGDMQNRIRNTPGSFERGIKSIQFFHDIGVPRICVSATLLEDNLRDFPRLTEEVFRAGANLMQVQPRIFQDGKPERNAPEVVRDAFRFMLEARRRGFPVEAGEQFGYLGPLEPLLRSAPFFCGSGWNTFCLNPDGMVLACPASTLQDQTEGNCTKDALRDIWKRGFSSLRKGMPDGLPDGCTRCPHAAVCRGGCWLFRAHGLNPCFLFEAEQVYREITNAALYPQAP